MRWFKHMTDASRDPFVVELEAVFGLEGYARWWKLLEIVSDQIEPEKGRWTVGYTLSSWARFLSAKRKIAETFLEHCRNKGKINTKCSGDIIEIEICNLQRIRDNYTKDLQAAGKKLASKDLEQKENIKTPPSASHCTPKGGGGCEKPTGNRLTIPPKIEWVVAYAQERKAQGNPEIDPQEFFDFYSSANWFRGKTKIKDWQGCWRTWESQRKNGPVQRGLPMAMSPSAKMSELRGKMARALLAEREQGGVQDGIGERSTQGADEALPGLPAGAPGGGRAAAGAGTLARVFGSGVGSDPAPGDGGTPKGQPLLPHGGRDR